MEDLSYELKKELYELIVSRELPEDIRKLADVVKLKLKTILASRNYLEGKIELYIDGQFEEIKPYIIKLQKAKNEQDFEQVNSIISQINLRVEEPSEIQKAFDMEPMSDIRYLEQAKRYISTINTKEINIKISRELIDILCDVIEDIRNYSNRGLNLNGRNYEELNYEISQFKNYLQANITQELYNSLNNEDKKLINHVYGRFEKYFYIEKNLKQNSEPEKTFKEELDAGISLEQQSENAKAFMDNIEENNEQEKSEYEKGGSLPDDVIK